MAKINPQDIGLKSYQTKVHQDGTKLEFRYQGNLIAVGDGNFLKIDNCGWKTQTTKQRLNVILSLYGLNFMIVQRDGVWYLIDSKTQGKKPFLGTATFLNGNWIGA